MYCVLSLLNLILSIALSPSSSFIPALLILSLCLSLFQSFLLFLFSASPYLFLFHLQSFLLFLSQPLSVSFSLWFSLLFSSSSLSFSFYLSPNFHSYAFPLFSLFSLITLSFLCLPYRLYFFLLCACLQFAHSQCVCVGGIWLSYGQSSVSLYRFINSFHLFSLSFFLHYLYFYFSLVCSFAFIGRVK